MNPLARVGRIRREFPRLATPSEAISCSLAAASLHSIGITKQLEQRAWISRSAAMPATAIERQTESSSSLTASGKVRREVPLPSQEKKEGAMQYAL